ncbi:hypothetical protein ACNKHW_11410 [Shigella flexneri]
MKRRQFRQPDRNFRCYPRGYRRLALVGVPFYLRTGKRMPMKCSEVVVYFKPPFPEYFQRNLSASAAE